MQTNNLFACKATDGALHIITARDTEVAILHPAAVTFNMARLRPVEARWLAYAAENFDAMHGAALKAGAQQKHPLTILPEEEVA